MKIKTDRSKIYLEQQLQLKKQLEAIRQSITHQIEEVGGRGAALAPVD